MPPKRRRVDEDVGGGLADAATSELKPHDELWFTDGSIVLASDVHMFRVHKSMLAKYSTVLSDMFEIPSEGANTERWEDIPIVRMAGDTDEEVCELLKALYSRNFYESLGSTNLSAIASLPYITTKYDFRDIRGDVMRHLESLFPTTYENYKKSKVHIPPITEAEIFKLLNAAYRCDALSILPVVYYRCAIVSVEKAVNFIFDLPEQCARQLLTGREWLAVNSQLHNLRSLPSTACCSGQIRPIAVGYIKSDLSFKFALDLPERGILEGLNNVCASCEAKYMQQLSTTTEFLWKNLASRFTGKTWEQLS